MLQILLEILLPECVVMMARLNSLAYVIADPLLAEGVDMIAISK